MMPYAQKITIAIKVIILKITVKNTVSGFAAKIATITKAPDKNPKI